MIAAEQPADLRVVFERFARDRRMTLLRFAGVLSGNPVHAEDMPPKDRKSALPGSGHDAPQAARRVLRPAW
ncbi:MAG: hypothetical protein ACR2JQ_09705 [Mycobacteriales bacterium]